MKKYYLISVIAALMLFGSTQIVKAQGVRPWEVTNHWCYESEDLYVDAMIFSGKAKGNSEHIPSLLCNGEISVSNPETGNDICYYTLDYICPYPGGYAFWATGRAKGRKPFKGKIVVRMEGNRDVGATITIKAETPNLKGSYLDGMIMTGLPN